MLVSSLIPNSICIDTLRLLIDNFEVYNNYVVPYVSTEEVAI